MNMQLHKNQQIQQHQQQQPQFSQQTQHALQPVPPQLQQQQPIIKLHSMMLQEGAAAPSGTAGTSKKKVHQQQYKYHSADMGLDHGEGVPLSSVSAGGMAGEALIRLQPISQSKLRGPGSGSDDDLSIVDDINASSNGPEGAAQGGQTHKKNVTKVKAGSIIVVNQQQHAGTQPKKITASKNKFDISSLVAQGQDGCPSRKTSSRDKSYPSNNSAAAAMGTGLSMLVGSHTFANSHLNHKLITQTQHDPTTQQKSQSNERKQASAGGSALFTSFFSQQQPAGGVDSQTYDFLTKTLGSTVSAQASNQGLQINPQNSIIKAPSTGKQILKKGVDIDIVRKQEPHQLMSSQVNQQQLLNSKNKTDDKTAITPLYNSFQQQHQPLSSFSQQQKGHVQKPGGTATVPGSQTVSQQFIHTLNTFTQNYYGAQHEKMKKRQNQIQSIHQSKLKGGASALGASGQNPYHKRDNSEGVQNSRQQLKFGQIMEELEKFSISNTNQLLNFHHHNKEEDALTESVAAQSSICESELEFTYIGNIRASTYKRTVENQEQRRRLIKYKSEERKREPSFFTKEYMDNRYINDRVEVELKDFKAEIEKKYEGSKLREFKFPRIPTKAASTTRPNRQLKALPQVYGQSRGHSAEEDPIEAILKQQLPQRITLGGKNVIFKTTGSGLSKQPKTGNLAKGKNLNVLEEFPVEITKTHDLRLHGLQITKQDDHASSFNQSITDIMMPQSLTQDSIMFIEQTQKKPSSSANRQHQIHNTQGQSQNNKAQMNVLLQNFIKQSFDNRDGQLTHQAKPQLNVIGTGSSTKKSSKVMNISKDNNMSINTFDASQPSSNLNRVALQKIQPPPSSDEAQLKKQQNPKNYSLQLNQVVKKILNDSSGGKEDNTVQPGGKSFDAAQMVYEPSFYTTESYKHGGVQQHQFNPNLSQVQQQQHYFTKDNAKLDVVKNEAEEDEEEEDQMLQSYTNVSDHKKRNATSTKKPLKVKRSDSNGSQQKNTLLNKIFRSSKTLKSPQSRQSNMNLNNQNAMNPAAIQKAGPTAQAEMLRFIKPSQTVHQSNINSNMSSVRQLQIIQSKQPISHSRQGSSGIRATAKSTAQKGSRLPSTSNKKHHQHNLSHVPSTHNQNNLLNFQTDTGASFHNYPQSNSNRGGAHSKEKKGINSLLIKSSQIKRTSAERQTNSQTRADQNLMKTKGSVLSTISAKETSLTHSKVGQTQLLDTSANFVHMQRSFHTNHATISGVPVSGPGLVDQSLLLKKQNNAPTASTVVKGSVTSSPTNQQQKKSQSMTTKNGQRHPSNVSGQPGTKLVNLGILNQISNPQTNGRGGKITYRNNYQRGIGSNNNTNIIVPGQHFTVITQSAISMSKKPGSSGERAGITSGGLNIIGTGAAHHDYLASIQQNALKRQ